MDFEQRDLTFGGIIIGKNSAVHELHLLAGTSSFWEQYI